MATNDNTLIISPAGGSNLTATNNVNNTAALGALMNYLATQNAVGTSSTASGGGATATGTTTVLNTNVADSPIAGGWLPGQLPTAAQTNFQFSHLNSGTDPVAIVFGANPAIQNLAYLAYRANGGTGLSVVPSNNVRAYYNLLAILAIFNVNIARLILNSNQSLVSKTMSVATAGLGTNVQDASATPTFTDQSYNNVNAVMAENFSMPQTVGLAIEVAPSENLAFNFMITPLLRQLA